MSRRNPDPYYRKRRNREAPLKVNRGFDAVFHQSPLVSELLAYNIHRKKETIDLCISNINSDDFAVRTKGTKELAEIMETDPRLVQLLTSKDIDLLVGCLKFDKDISGRVVQPIQYHAAVIIKVIFSSKHLGEEITDKALQLLVKLLGVENIDVIEKAAIALTKMTYNSPDSCKIILKLDVLRTLEKIVTLWARDFGLVTRCAMLLGAICTGLPDLNTEKRKVALDITKTILRRHIMPETCIALAKLSDGRYTEMIANDFEVLIEYLCGYPSSTIIPALEVVGNIARWGTNSQIQLMITNGVMQPLQRLLFHVNKILRKEACWIISNITAVNNEEDAIKTDLVDDLCNLLDNDELEVKIEAGWAILNLIYSKSTDLRDLKMRCWETLLRQQKCQHSEIVNICTKAIRTLPQLVNEDVKCEDATKYYTF